MNSVTSSKISSLVCIHMPQKVEADFVCAFMCVCLGTGVLTAALQMSDCIPAIVCERPEHYFFSLCSDLGEESSADTKKAERGTEGERVQASHRERRNSEGLVVNEVGEG